MFPPPRLAALAAALLVLAAGEPRPAVGQADAEVLARTDRFVFVGPPSAQGLARVLAEEAEEIRDEVAADLGRDYPGVSEVRVAPSTRAFRQLQPAGYEVPFWAAGVAFPPLNLVVLNAGSGRTADRLERILAHEVSHLALGRLSPGGFPRWFLEGFATYQADEWDFGRTAVLAAAVSGEQLIPLDDLTRRWPDEPADVQVAYAQSIHLVGWLFREHGREAIHRLVAEVAEGTPFTEALETATGVPAWKLERTWQDDLKLRYGILPAVLSTGFIWGVTSLLFVLVYLIRRRRRGRRLRAMEEAERRLYEGEAEGAPGPQAEGPRGAEGEGAPAAQAEGVTPVRADGDADDRDGGAFGSGTR